MKAYYTTSNIQGQIDDYFDGEKCRVFEQQIDGIAARFFRSHSEGLFDTFGETATPSSMLANAEAAVNFAEVHLDAVN